MLLYPAKSRFDSSSCCSNVVAEPNSSFRCAPVQNQQFPRWRLALAKFYGPNLQIRVSGNLLTLVSGFPRLRDDTNNYLPRPLRLEPVSKGGSIRERQPGIRCYEGTRPRVSLWSKCRASQLFSFSCSFFSLLLRTLVPSPS